MLKWLLQRTQTHEMNNPASKAVSKDGFCPCSTTLGCLPVGLWWWFAQIQPSLTCSPLWSAWDIFKVAGLGFLPFVAFTNLAPCSDLEIQSSTDKNKTQNQIFWYQIKYFNSRLSLMWTQEELRSQSLVSWSFPFLTSPSTFFKNQHRAHPERWFLAVWVLGFTLRLPLSRCRHSVCLFTG